MMTHKKNQRAARPMPYALPVFRAAPETRRQHTNPSRSLYGESGRDESECENDESAAVIVSVRLENVLTTSVGCWPTSEPTRQATVLP